MIWVELICWFALSYFVLKLASEPYINIYRRAVQLRGARRFGAVLFVDLGFAFVLAAALVIPVIFFSELGDRIIRSESLLVGYGVAYLVTVYAALHKQISIIRELRRH